jgi:hypothetical protein
MTHIIKLHYIYKYIHIKRYTWPPLGSTSARSRTRSRVKVRLCFFLIQGSGNCMQTCAYVHVYVYMYINMRMRVCMAYIYACILHMRTYARTYNVLMTHGCTHCVQITHIHTIKYNLPFVDSKSSTTSELLRYLLLHTDVPYKTHKHIQRHNHIQAYPAYRM